MTTSTVAARRRFGVRRLGRWSVALLAAASACSGATATPPSSSPAPTSSDLPPLSLVVLGDSIAIPSKGCGNCTGFDEQYRAFLETSTGRSVVLSNLARPDAQIADLQALLDSDSSVQHLIGGADVVVVSIGYNNSPPWTPDVPCHPKEGKVDTDLLVVLRDFTDACIAATDESFRDDFEHVYARIEQLAAGRHQLRIDLGTFNNALGNPGGDGTLPPVWAGKDAPGFPQSDLPKALAHMRTAIAGFNKVECESATANGFVCAGLLKAFNGADGSGSLAAYVNPADYVHPNEVGQRIITGLLSAIDLGPLR